MKTPRGCPKLAVFFIQGVSMGLLRKLVSSLFGESIAKDQSLSDYGRVQGYQLLLQTQLAQAAPNFRASVDSLDLTRLPDGTKHLHLEIFVSDFEMRLFAFDDAWNEVFDETDQVDELERVNAEIDSMPPLLNQEDRDRFIIWEETETGRQEALEQPIDGADLSKSFAPFASHVMEGLQGRFSGKVTAGFHDDEANLLDLPHRTIFDRDKS
ncbi:hypothetical protein [Pelagimonas phthalicica]|nr:hypothetical protein [Pelagimonas phthalicica]